MQEIGISVEEIAGAIKSTKRRFVLDGDGICLASLEWLLIAKPLEFTSWINKTAATTEEFFTMTCMGRPYGKTSNQHGTDDLRMILPLSSILAIFDIIVSKRLNVLLDSHFNTPRPGVFVGAKRFTQPLDVAHTL